MNEGSAEIWVVDPSTREAEAEGFAEVVDGWAGNVRLLLPSLRPGDGPRGGDRYPGGGIVVMGSSASVHDPDDWIGDLAAWLRPVVHGEIAVPLLGICFGHQLIAHVAGAPVGFRGEERDKLLGVAWSRFDGSRLIRGRRDLRVVVSHREEVKQLPLGFCAIARRDTTPLDGFEHETLPIAGVQFHPEARVEFARRAGIATELIDRRLREDGRLVLSAFRGWCREAGRR